MKNRYKHHQNIFSVFLPKAWTDAFEVTDIEERPNEWRVVMTEKTEMIPPALARKEVVLDGYLDPLELVDFPLRGKLLYVSFIRRRWKETGTIVGHHNVYDFHPEGAKVTHDFGNFLKGLTRDEFNEFCFVWPGVRNCWEEDRCMVS